MWLAIAARSFSRAMVAALPARISLQRCGSGGRSASSVRLRNSASLACLKNLQQEEESYTKTGLTILLQCEMSEF
jgi:hypothetical protein